MLRLRETLGGSIDTTESSSTERKWSQTMVNFRSDGALHNHDPSMGEWICYSMAGILSFYSRPQHYSAPRGYVSITAITVKGNTRLGEKGPEEEILNSE